jgi:Flp pilus assembly protein TadG
MRARRDERGFISIWMLGLGIVVLFLGGLSLDLWRAYSVRRTVAEMVDAAADAGASGLDEASFRQPGQAVRLDPARAEALARDALAADPASAGLESAEVCAAPQRVTVRASALVHLSLLRVLMADHPLRVVVTGRGEPRAST